MNLTAELWMGLPGSLCTEEQMRRSLEGGRSQAEPGNEKTKTTITNMT